MWLSVCMCLLCIVYLPMLKVRTVKYLRKGQTWVINIEANYVVIGNWADFCSDLGFAVAHLKRGKGSYYPECQYLIRPIPNRW